MRSMGSPKWGPLRFVVALHSVLLVFAFVYVCGAYIHTRSGSSMNSSFFHSEDVYAAVRITVSILRASVTTWSSRW